MIIEAEVEAFSEGYVDGERITDIIQLLQGFVDKYGGEASLEVSYDPDGFLMFNVKAPREETQFEKQLRESLERRAEDEERAQLARLKEKYGS